MGEASQAKPSWQQAQRIPSEAVDGIFLLFSDVPPLCLHQAFVSSYATVSNTPGTYLLLQLQHRLLHLVKLLARGTAGAGSHRVLHLLIVP